MSTVFQQMNLAVRDMERASDFYRLLGLDVPKSFEWPEGSGAHHVEVVMPGGHHLALDNHEMMRIWHRGFTPGPTSGSPIIGLQLDSRSAVDELCERIRGAGYAVSVDPYDAFWGSRYAVVVDPDGHHVGLRSPVDEATRYEPMVDTDT